MSVTTPSNLGKYEIHGTLGRGAMGIVYDGWDPVIHRRVAIKTVRLPETNDQEAAEGLARFKREAQAAGRLTHPNIVGVFDYGETDEVAYIVMEFVAGRSLKDMLDADLRLPIAEVLRLLGEILSGLAYSHGRGVVHRDIKPANIMVTNDVGQAKIADFGIARIEASSMTQAGTVMGTPAYMSPEQFMGQVVDQRTDIYSCGILLYQLLTGERPYEGSMSSIMHKAMTITPPSPSELAVTAPKALDPIVARAMARRPDDRFASATDFAAALRAPAPIAPDSDATIMAPPTAPPSTPPTLPPARPNRTLIILAASAVLAFAAGAAAFLLRPSPQSEPPLAATQPSALPIEPPTSTLPPVFAATPTQTRTPVGNEAPAATVPETAASPPLVSAMPAPQQDTSLAVGPPTAPPPTPAATPVMTAPAPDPATLTCSLVQTTPTGIIALTGPKSEASVQRAVGTTPRLVDEAFCPVLDRLRAITQASPGVTLTLAQDGGTAPLHDEQVIALHATMPAFAGFLQIAYVQHDQTVAPLVPGPGYPAQTYPARASIALGTPRRDFPGWRVGPPFGTDMIVAIASTAPLFPQKRPETQSLDGYLANLQTAVDALRRRGGTVAATALPLDTRPLDTRPLDTRSTP